MAAETPHTLRSLKPKDLERVIEIDRKITGRSRRVFFEKRLEAALGSVESFIAVATESAGELTGYAIARLQHGEFGGDLPIALLDVIGVDPESRHEGQGAMLLEGILMHMKKRDIGELRTQVDWAQQELVKFFAANGFDLAPFQVLERATTRNV